MDRKKRISETARRPTSTVPAFTPKSCSATNPRIGPVHKFFDQAAGEKLDGPMIDGEIAASLPIAAGDILGIDPGLMRVATVWIASPSAYDDGARLHLTALTFPCPHLTCVPTIQAEVERQNTEG